MNLSLTPDADYAGTYKLKNGKELIAYVFVQSSVIEIGWVKNRFTMNVVQKILDFLDMHKWLTEPED